MLATQHLLHVFENGIHSIEAAQLATLIRHRPQTIRRRQQTLHQLRQRILVEVAFFLDESRADGLENTSVVQLLAILVVRIRDDDRRAPDRHQFGNRSPPTATNHEVGSGKQAIHVRRNCTHIRHVVPRHVGVAMPHRRVVAEPGQVHDLHLALHSLQRRRHNFIKNASTLATTGDQNDRHICLQP